MNSVTLIGTVQEPVDAAAFVLAVDHALVPVLIDPVLIDRSHPSPTIGNRVVVEGALRSGPADLRLEAASLHVLNHMATI